MALISIVVCIVFLILLIAWGKVNPFLAFLVVSIVAGLLLGLPLNKISSSVQKGIGDTLAGLVIIICLGAMLGKLIATSGAAKKIATVMMQAVGEKYIQLALVVTGFIIGIPLFYGVGFVLMVPLIFSVVYKYKLPAVYIGLPMLAALSVTHGFLPPHPSPVALAVQFNANIGVTLLYGIAIAIPAIIIAGPLFSLTLKKIPSQPLKTFLPTDIPDEELPGAANSFFTALLPVILLIIATVLPIIIKGNTVWNNAIAFFGDPSVVMLIALIVATWSLGIRQGKKIKELMEVYGDAMKDIVLILLIIAGSGAFKQILVDSGISQQIAAGLQNLPVQPLILGWLMAAIIRACLGSATVAGLTTGGIIAPLMMHNNINPQLMVLSIGAGSLAFSHVNDSGFWLFKEYFNLTIKDTLRSWSIMECIVSVVGLAGVLLLNLIIEN
ncbi:MAG: gluconate:H+ symporter [Chitinophagaceae bacterium]